MTDEPKLTPTEWLVLEVLAARRRLGHLHWPIERRDKPTLDRLQSAGYLSYESDPTGNWRTWLNTDPAGPAAQWLTGPVEYRPIYDGDPDDLALQWARHALDWLVSPLNSVIGVAVEPGDTPGVILWVADESNAWRHINEWSEDCPVPVRVRYVDDHDVHYLNGPGDCHTCKVRRAARYSALYRLPWWAWRRRRKLTYGPFDDEEWTGG